MSGVEALALNQAHATLMALAKILGPAATALFVERFSDSLHIETPGEHADGYWLPASASVSTKVQRSRKLMNEPGIRQVMAFRGVTAPGSQIVALSLKQSPLASLPERMLWRKGTIIFEDKNEPVLPDNNMTPHEQVCAAWIVARNDPWYDPIPF